MLTEGNTCCKERWKFDHVWWALVGRGWVLGIIRLVDLATSIYDPPS